MPLHNRSIPPSGDDDLADMLDQRLVLICRNLLERPSDRRGPFDISDNELRLRSRTTSAAARLRLAST
jgi:hypothetical protein